MQRNLPLNICLGHIYTCLPFKDVLLKIASLSKGERLVISKSNFIRESVHKEKGPLPLILVDNNWQTDLDDAEPIVPGMLEYLPKLFAEVRIEINSDFMNNIEKAKRPWI